LKTPCKIIKTKTADSYDNPDLGKKVLRISTGSQNLDELLFAGIETDAITEFYGSSGTGKTQLCHTLAVIVQEHQQKGGLNGKALYIDTDNTFRPERIVSIAQGSGLDSTSILNNIVYVKVLSSYHQDSILRVIPSQLDKDSKIGLLIIDSVIRHYRTEFQGPQILPERQQKLYQFMHTLSSIAQRYRIAVVVTNQVNFTNSYIAKAAGGHIMIHGSTHRISLRRLHKNNNSKNKIVAKIVNSSYYPEKLLIVRIILKMRRILL
jgi:DNA repair protein RadA